MLKDSEAGNIFYGVTG